MKSDYVGLGTDLISSAKQISSKQRLDFIVSISGRFHYHHLHLRRFYAIIHLRGDGVEILFKNTFTKTEEWIKECNKISFFRRPMFIAFHLLSILTLCYGIYKVLFLHTIDVWLLFIPIWWFFAVFMLYFISNKTAIKRNKELYGDKAEVVSEVTQDSIKQSHSNGSQYVIYYDTIKRGYLTKNYILLHSKANILYTFKKDGFSVGDEEGFLTFLRNQGIVIK